MSLGVKMKGKMAVLSVYLELCLHEIAEQSSNSKRSFEEAWALPFCRCELQGCQIGVEVAIWRRRCA